LFAKILLWFLATILLSLGAFLATSSIILSRLGPTEFFSRSIDLMVDDARRAYERGGSEELAGYLRRLDEHYRTRHYLTDPNGRDLVNGTDRAWLLARPPGEHGMPRPGRMVLVRPSQDGKYRLVTVVHRRNRVWTFLPSYLWIFLVVTFLCYILAVHLARPLRLLRRAVDRFGRGDLAARAHSTRKDEIGDLSRAFDRMADQIETLLTAERRLLQDVSHELRTPLARLRFAVELAHTGDDRESALSRIRKEVDRLADLVDQILQVTRAEGDPSSREQLEVPLHQLIESLVGDCALEAEVRGCRLALHVNEPADLPGDPELLRRAVENVLRNAIHHAPERTTVEVAMIVRGGSAIISVRDYGPGVPAEALEEMFKPFYRVEGDRGRDSGGIGLGLSIAQRAVQLHQGTVRARNAEPGLEIVIELPNVENPFETR
jgi:two-component system sensor histidine kinase CpxA